MELSTNYRELRRGIAVSVVLLGLFAGFLAVMASGAFAQSTSGVTNPPPAEVFALTTSDELVVFNGADPEVVIDRMDITGLESGESLVGIDFRPNDSNLYGVGDQSNIYLINEETGEAELFDTLEDEGGDVIALEGGKFGVDFNPVPDALRIVSNTGQNLRFAFQTGATFEDLPLNFSGGGGNPKVSGAAYTNSTQPSPRDPAVLGTTLYDIDFGLDILVTQNPPNDGTLNTVGELGIDTKGLVGFDIETTPGGGGGTTVTTQGDSTPLNRAFAALQPDDKKRSSFYSINLQTGEATRIGRIDGRKTKAEDIAIPIPTPAP